MRRFFEHRFLISLGLVLWRRWRCIKSLNTNSKPKLNVSQKRFLGDILAKAVKGGW